MVYFQLFTGFSNGYYEEKTCGVLGTTMRLLYGNDIYSRWASNPWQQTCSTTIGTLLPNAPVEFCNNIKIVLL